MNVEIAPELTDPVPMQQGTHYQQPENAGIGEGATFLTGARDFRAAELEVFRVSG